jgi:putative ABC transport system ATP-binding protein
VTDSSPILSASQLGKTVSPGNQTLTLLSEIELSIEPGEAVAIIGPSGSGKSTLLGLLAGLDSASSGEVSLLGQNLSTLNEDQRAQLRAGRVGFVFQSFQLMSGLTALENVLIPLELSGNARNAEDEARSVLQRVGLGERLQHFPDQLSGGEQQRVALARAFVTQPELLFADEPTGNLDQATGNQIIELLFELQASAATTLVLVTHDDALAARCQRRYHLDSGRIAEV